MSRKLNTNVSQRKQSAQNTYPILQTQLETNKFAEEEEKRPESGGGKRGQLLNELVSPTAVHQKVSGPHIAYKPYAHNSGTIEPTSVKGTYPLRDTSKLSSSQSKLMPNQRPTALQKQTHIRSVEYDEEVEGRRMSITDSSRLVQFKQQTSRMPGSAMLKRGATAASRHKHFLLGGITTAISGPGNSAEMSLERSFLQDHNRTGITRKGGRYGDELPVKGVIHSQAVNTSTDRQAAPRLTQEMKSRALMAGSSTCSPLKNFENLQRFRSNLPVSRNSSDRVANPTKVQNSAAVLDESNVNKLHEVTGKSRQAPQQTLLSATNSQGRKLALAPTTKQTFSSIDTTSSNLRGLTSRSGAGESSKITAVASFGGVKPSLTTIRPSDVKQSLVESTSSLRVANNETAGLRNSRSTKNSHLLYQRNSSIANNYISNQSVSSPPLHGTVPKTAAVSHRGPTMTNKLSKYMQQRQNPGNQVSHTTITAPERVQSLVVQHVSSTHSTPMRERPPPQFGHVTLQGRSATGMVDGGSSLGPVGANSGPANRKGGHKQPRQSKNTIEYGNPPTHIQSQVYLANEQGDQSALQLRQQMTETSLPAPESGANTELLVDEANRQSILNFSKRVREQTLMHLSTAAQANQLYQQHQEGKSMPRRPEVNTSSVSSVRRQVKKSAAVVTMSQASGNSISSPGYIKIVGPGSNTLLSQQAAAAENPGRSHSTTNKNKVPSPRTRDASGGANKSVARRYQVPPAKSQRGKSSDPNLDANTQVRGEPTPQPTTAQSHSRLNTSFKGSQPAVNNFMTAKRQPATLAPPPQVSISISPQRKRQNDMQAAKAYGGTATKTQSGIKSSTISVYSVQNKQSIQQLQQSKQLSNTTTSRPQKAPFASKMNQRTNPAETGASPDKRPTMSKSQAQQATTRPKNYQRRYVVGTLEVTRPQQEAATRMQARGNNRRQNNAQLAKTAASASHHPYTQQYSKSPVKKVYNSNVQQIASHMINVSTRKNQQSKPRLRPQVPSGIGANQSFRGPDSIPQVDSSRTDQSKDSPALKVGTYEEQEKLYRKRQDEIVKKIQSNIKRSEELDNLAEESRLKQQQLRAGNTEKALPVTEAFSKAIMSINDNFSNLSQLLSPKTNDAVPSSMPPHITLKQRHFLFNREGNCHGGSGVNTPENLFGSQDGEEERPVSVGDHLRVDVDEATVADGAPDVTFDALSVPVNDQTVDEADQTVVQMQEPPEILRATGPSIQPVQTLFGPKGMEKLEIEVNNQDNSSIIAMAVSGPTTPPSGEASKHEIRVESANNAGIDHLNDKLLALTQKSPQSDAKPLEKEKLEFPMKVDDFVAAFDDVLYDWEKEELGKYSTVFYAGEITSRDEPITKDEEMPCFDDTDGYYTFIMNQHVSYRYEVLRMLGKGSFAQVVSVKDHKTGKNYALKVNRNTEIDHKFAEQEASLLKFLMKEDPDDENNIVRMLEHTRFRQHQCFFFELLYNDLFEYLKEHDFKGFQEEQIRTYTTQLLTALAFLQKRQIIHCDLKPENIMLTDSECKGLKVVDFGSGCFLDQQVYTYVQSRFYRSPEVILRIPYTEKVDIWSLGCILAELFTGEPLFPGNNEQEQLEYIMEVKGIPPDSMIDKSRKKEHYFDTDYSPFLIEDEDYGILRIPEDRKLRMAVPSGDRLFIDFLGRCLELDPESRMSADQALQHPWITQDEETSAVFLQSIQYALDAEQQEESSSASAPDFGGGSETKLDPSLMQLVMFQQEGLAVIEQANDEEDDNELQPQRHQQNSSQHSNVTASFHSGEILHDAEQQQQIQQHNSPPEKTTIQARSEDDQIANCFSLSVTDANELLEPAIISSPQKVVVEGSPEEALLQQQQQIQQNSMDKVESTYFKKQAGRRKKQNI